MNKEWIFATRNKGKVAELSALLEPLNVSIQALSGQTDAPEVEETGSTFMANAKLKAEAIAKWANRPAIADDSGLCVDALDGAPGVYSARYAGPDATDAQNNEKLIRELTERFGQQKERLSTAHFVCALALYDPQQDRWILAEGRCSGWIISEPRGNHGFGYDPLFYLPEHNKTMAEVSPEIKNEISHRGIAMRNLMMQLRDYR